MAELRLVLSYIQRVGLPNLQVHFCKSSATSHWGERTSASCTSSTTSSLSTNLSTSSNLRWLTMGRECLRADHFAPVFRQLGEREVKAQGRNVLCLRGRMHAPGSECCRHCFLTSSRPRGSSATFACAVMLGWTRAKLLEKLYQLAYFSCVLATKPLT